eukprot:CAMPEP_0119539694 /NCGR_PEP_ID=MMETSP1344-20130328/51776_1 /TAXON_ID=236787 /ORGANISM="Florenciella parvula, Strain CCMP2471" /LENGTH=83 /DNA_ID=CAMNT_0007583097 /DNA_START=43 /DNA_END=292 /DNA_ORIENTATION=-
MAQPAMSVCSHKKVGLPTITHMALLPSCTAIDTPQRAERTDCFSLEPNGTTDRTGRDGAKHSAVYHAKTPTTTSPHIPSSPNP